MGVVGVCSAEDVYAIRRRISAWDISEEEVMN